MSELNKLKSVIRNMITEVTDEEKKKKVKKESTTTGNVDGYSTPHAFAKGGKHHNDFKKRMQNVTGGTLVYENRYLELKLDTTKTPNQKIGVGVRGVRKKIEEIEKFLDWYDKIKSESNLSSDKFWKRTNTHIFKIREKLKSVRKNVNRLKK